MDNYDEISVEYFCRIRRCSRRLRRGDRSLSGRKPDTLVAQLHLPGGLLGEVIKDTFTPKTPSGMLGFVFNLRRPIFQDMKLRQGLALVFDFEWGQQDLFDNAYTRTQSFWQNSTLSYLGNPADDRELALLGDIRNRIKPAILDGSYRLPVTDASGRDRNVLREAVTLLREAGYSIKDGKMVSAEGRP